MAVLEYEEHRRKLEQIRKVKTKYKAVADARLSLLKLFNF